MRRLLFAHDDHIHIDSSKDPVSYNYTRHLVDRYRYLADSITFAVRCEANQLIQWHDDAQIACIPEMKHGRKLVRYFDAKTRVERLVSEHDLVVARLPSLIGSWALRASWRFRKPVLVEFVGCPWDALSNHSIKGKLVAPLFFLKNRWLMRRCAHSIYVTERFLQTRYPTEGASICCSNVEARLSSMERMRSRKARLQGIGTSGRVVLGTVANIDVPYKAQDLVIRAVAELASISRNSFVYRLIGPGDSARLRHLAEGLGVSDCIDFVGAVGRETIPEILDDIDIYIQPSLQEGLPRAMIEAMARGCVAIGSKTGGIPELLPPSWVTPRGDWRAIARLLRRLGERDLVAASQRNWKKASEYQLDILTERRQRFYDQFLADHNLQPVTNSL